MLSWLRKDSLHKKNSPPETTDDTNLAISIVISTKNEANNLSSLFDSLKKVRYHCDFEIIIVDDHSTDDSYRILQSYSLSVPHCQIYRLGSDVKGKKMAISLGIAHSKYGWIALSDADCIIHPDWLDAIYKNITCYPSGISMLVGYSPEMYINNFQYFKHLASAIIYHCSISAGVPYSCSGRNLIFNKKDFYEVGGYEPYLHITSGDDKLLLNSFSKQKKNIKYMPYPPIYTAPVEKKIITHQNLRRYGKFGMSSPFWKIFTAILGLLLLWLPIEVAISGQLAALIMYALSINLFFGIGCLIHREPYRVCFLWYTVIFPYYLAFQMIKSTTRKWTWK
jgi:glycosyltransferase involved in cell wall biosynthesis